MGAWITNTTVDTYTIPVWDVATAPGWRARANTAAPPYDEDEVTLAKLKQRHRETCRQAFSSPLRREDRPARSRTDRGLVKEAKVAARRRAGAR